MIRTKDKVVTVFGGTGFIGRHVVRELASLGMVIKVATRQPERAYFLRPCGNVGQVVPFTCDYSDESIKAAVKGADFVVNCVGILYERKKGDFKRIHDELPEKIAKAAKKENVRRFVHVSALGVEKSRAQYAQSKREGEQAVLKAFPDATILRPSIVFGPEDDFFNKFASLSRFMPFLPLIGEGNTKFQPVYVGDVADAIVQAVLLTGLEGEDPRGKTYELGGPETMTLKALFERMLELTGRKRMLLPLPWHMAKMHARLLSLFPNPLLTPDQVELLKSHNVVSKTARKFENLSIKPTGMGLILAEYMEPYRRGGRYGDKKRA